MNVARVLLFGACLSLIPAVALADTISGGVNVSGHDTFNTNTLTFVSPFASIGDTGAAAGFSNGTVDYLLGTVSYMDGVGGSLEVFTVTDSTGNVLDFFTTNNDAASGINPSTGNWDITLNETGYYILNGGPELPGYFNVSFYGQAPDGSGGPSSFSGSGGFSADFADTAPEPSTALLFGTALLGLGALALRRRAAARSFA